MWRSRWAAIGAAVAVSLGAGGLFVAQAAPGPSESTIVTVTPERILDTRDPVNLGLAGPFTSPVAQKLQVTGSIPTATGTKVVVPAGATGVLLNVTPVNMTANGFISIRPGDATGAATTSSLNFTTGVAGVVPNAVQVAMPTAGANAGKIDITYDAYGQAGQTTDILVDVVGYMTNTGLQELVADVATKAATTDVAALPASHIIAAGVVNGTGLKNAFAAQLGTYSVSRTSVGLYALTVPMVCAPNKFPVILLSLGFDVANGGAISLGLGTCSGGQATFAVRTFDNAGTLTDKTWSFTAFSNASVLAGAPAPLVDDAAATDCVTTDGSPCE
jgi:hypothetical protein